ncbi:MAG: S-adenosylmethionine decarboxylase [archaeon]|nr:S-adenosylmethionine decarboxylase [archaeon]
MSTWKNLAPDLVRQRVIIECTTKKMVSQEQIKKYLLGLAKVTKMQVLSGPFTDTAHELGESGWVHWKTSGAHVYSYPTKSPLLTVDCYTCKPFSVKDAVDFTKKYFEAIEIVYKEIEV